MVGTRNVWFGRNWALQEMRNPRKYGVVRNREVGINEEAEGPKEKEWVKEKSRQLWWRWIYRHGSLSWNTMAFSGVWVFQRCNICSHMRCAKLEPEDIVDDKGVSICVCGSS